MLDVHLFVDEKRKLAAKTDKWVNFSFEPNTTMEFFTMLGADRRFPSVKLVLLIEEQEYLGLLVLGSEKLQIFCDITGATNSNPNGFCRQKSNQR